MLELRIYCVIFFLVLSGCTGSIDVEGEPICTSRFDYDHKMLRTLIMLELEHENLKKAFSDIKDLVGKYEDSDKKCQRSLEHIVQRLSRVERAASLDGQGSIYIRWGKTSCPGNGTELIYKGFAAGSQYSQSGAASSYLCLPEDPTWSVYDDTPQNSGTVWGAEYEFVYRNEDAFFGKSLQQRDVPCSVCRTQRASVLMIPGRHVCYDGWTTEYYGYLMSGHDAHHATDFVCVDDSPEALIGGDSNDNGKLFYFTEGRCGSLRCPPYVNGRELTCSVCSK